MRRESAAARAGAGAVIAAIAIGVCAGVVAGLLGVGGGVLFVPGLVIFLGLGQHQAEATSLLAIIPVAIVGTYKQDGYGNVRRHDALLMGLLSIAGAAAGVALANALSGTVLRVGFAALMVLVALQLVRKALDDPESADSPRREVSRENRPTRDDSA
ncbi:MAG TPA: sulfite exporter TauE/SafE family protein [Solirubrobacteraceae bacterium]|nr:sulfite exporter TauE/SafE family protein [Solirubrobacteraceae bacterium]